MMDEVSRDISEPSMLELLARRDLSSALLQSLASHAVVQRSRKCTFALAIHRNAPRFVVLPLLRRMFAFELMQVAMTPSALADIRRLAEDLLLGKLENTTPGERMTIAKHGSTRLVAALLRDSDARVVSAALHNGRLTEAALAAALRQQPLLTTLVEEVKKQPMWMQRATLRQFFEELERRESGQPQSGNESDATKDELND